MLTKLCFQVSDCVNPGLVRVAVPFFPGRRRCWFALRAFRLLSFVRRAHSATVRHARPGTEKACEKPPDRGCPAPNGIPTDVGRTSGSLRTANHTFVVLAWRARIQRSTSGRAREKAPELACLFPTAHTAGKTTPTTPWHHRVAARAPDAPTLVAVAPQLDAKRAARSPTPYAKRPPFPTLEKNGSSSLHHPYSRKSPYTLSSRSTVAPPVVVRINVPEFSIVFD
ncbi:microtubule-actin cross-linking factor 1, isoforms 1/2/3/5 [Anopheles sinensis]|uniref:Microtubule-actin cross-linking factor 1, isoforms 1/2/3/5 n=1 Tax=Anopheles sinensis TaxID=74873 RepID=A0A084VGX3_ANOSI|nr:microtubule-actin cross-linking factor 1, isoforms 1/2/3/5 [Anopheles sinensis]